MKSTFGQLFAYSLKIGYLPFLHLVEQSFIIKVNKTKTFEIKNNVTNGQFTFIALSNGSCAIANSLCLSYVMVITYTGMPTYLPCLI